MTARKNPSRATEQHDQQQTCTELKTKLLQVKQDLDRERAENRDLKKNLLESHAELEALIVEKRLTNRNQQVSIDALEQQLRFANHSLEAMEMLLQSTQVNHVGQIAKMQKDIELQEKLATAFRDIIVESLQG